MAQVRARPGEEYGFVVTARGTIRHQGVDTPPPGTVEGLLYALPEDSHVTARKGHMITSRPYHRR
ncbi:hypothetical protein GCM10010206_61250 [Streptomyces cinerochromogenes]|nr:hypothetical protein GCM10010206_61250 [Streptomyces cinerochromogenes]